MNRFRTLLRGTAALAFALAVAAPASATSLIRADLDELTRKNSTVIVGEVVDVASYWNTEGTFILTDVHIAPREVLKGQAKGAETTVTLLGGSVDDLSTLIVGGAELIPGRSYVLFLNAEDLPGSRGSLTVRDHCQGVFEIVEPKDGGQPRAVSQASRHPLLPDKQGVTEAPGGVAGLSLPSLEKSIRTIAGREADSER